MSRTAHTPAHRSLFLMALTVFIDFTSFGLIIPLLPFWAERAGATAFGVGVVLTAFALTQFLCTPLLGTLSDRYGRRPVILASLVIQALAFALAALATTLPVLLVARLIGGLGASNVGSAQAVVADITTPAERARGMGMIGAAIGLGFVVGPALGGVLATFGPGVPFWVAMLVAIVNALLVLILLPETRSPNKNSAVGAAPRGIALLLGGWRSARRSPVIARILAINLLFTLAFAAMEAIFPLYTQRIFRWTAEQNGYLFTFIGVIIVLMQGGLVGRLVKIWGERSLVIGGLLLLAFGLAGLAALPLLPQIGGLLLAVALLSVGEGAVTPSASALLSFATPPDAQGATLGFAQGVAGLGRVMGPLTAGSLFALSGPGAPFIAGAILVLLAVLLAMSVQPGARQGAPPGVKGSAPVLAIASEETRGNHRDTTQDNRELSTRL